MAVRPFIATQARRTSLPAAEPGNPIAPARLREGPAAGQFLFAVQQAAPPAVPPGRIRPAAKADTELSMVSRAP